MFESAARRDLLASDEVGGKRESPCPVCCGESYSWGTLSAQGINFKPNDASILSKFFRFGVQIPARRCDLCGNLQIFAQIPDARRG